jgi:hypothetical protein
MLAMPHGGKNYCTFVVSKIGTKSAVCPLFLITAWVTWALSTFAVLISYHLSHRALRRTIDQVDNGKIHEQKPGGKWSVATELVNIIGAVFFSYRCLLYSDIRVL